MAKRFTDTNKYKKPFIRGLLGPYKLLWDYLYHDCDHAGIWIVDFEIAQVYLGHDMKVSKEDALRYFNAGQIRIIEIDSNHWFIVPFIEFQYGELNEQNRAHNSVIQVLKNYNLWDGANKGLASPLLGCKDMDKDMDKDKDKDKEGCGEKKQTRSADEKINFSFDEFWNQYDKKRGDRSKLEKKWQSLSDHDRTAIMAYIPQYKKSQPNKAFRKDPATFLNNKSWNDELISSAKNSVQPQEGYFDKQREEMRLAREQQSKKSS